MLSVQYLPDAGAFLDDESAAILRGLSFALPGLSHGARLHHLRGQQVPLASYYTYLDTYIKEVCRIYVLYSIVCTYIILLSRM